MKLLRQSLSGESLATLNSCVMARMVCVNILAMVALMFHLASCSNDDPEGKWDAMSWKAEVPVVIEEGGIYDVSADGGTLTFTCRNYSYPWIENVETNGEYFFPPRDMNDYHTVTTGWFKAEIVGNKLNVTFESNNDNRERSLALIVTAGDIFHTFKFKQFAN